MNQHLALFTALLCSAPLPGWAAGQVPFQPTIQAIQPSQTEAWNGATWGMTINQVVQLFPDIQQIAPDEAGQLRWVLKDVPDAGMVVDVYFVFEGNALIGIEIIEVEAEL